MKRALAIVLIALLAAAALLGGFSLFSKLRIRSNTYYTDAESVRVKIEEAPVRDVLWEPPLHIGQPINSTDDEYESKIAADGRTIYLVRGRAGEGADIFISHRLADAWTEPEPFAPANSEYDDFGAAPSADGRAIYFYSNRPGGLGGYDIWMIERAEGGWTQPRNLGANVNSQYNDYGPAPAPDGALFFASNRPKETDTHAPAPDAWSGTLREDLYKNDYDLYVSARTADGFASAHYLDALNSETNEGSPAVTPRGDFLYFASDRTGGEGGYDIYRTRLAPDLPLAPANLGDPVNTRANELDPSLEAEGFVLYFSSDRGRSPLKRASPTLEADAPERGDFNIYRATSREVFRHTDEVAARVDWGEFWQVLWPILLWLLVALLLFLILLKLYQRMELNRLSLLAKCLLASLLIHLLIMLLMTGWNVTTNLANFMRDTRMQVALVTHSRDPLTSQIFGDLTQVEFETSNESSAERAESQIEREHATTAESELTVEQSEAQTPERLITRSESREASPAEELATAEMTPEVAAAEAPDLTMPDAPQPTAQAESTMRAEAASTSAPRQTTSRIAQQSVTAPAEARITPPEIVPSPSNDRLVVERPREREAAPESQRDPAVPVSFETPPISHDATQVATAALPEVTPSAPMNPESEAQIVAKTSARGEVHRDAPVLAAVASTERQHAVLHPSAEVDADAERTFANASPTLQDVAAEDIRLPTAAPQPPAIPADSPTRIAVALPAAADASSAGEDEPSQYVAPQQTPMHASATDAQQPILAAVGPGLAQPFQPAATESARESQTLARSSAPSDAALRDVAREAPPLDLAQLALPSPADAEVTELASASSTERAAHDEATTEVAAARAPPDSIALREAPAIDPAARAIVDPIEINPRERRSKTKDRAERSLAAAEEESPREARIADSREAIPVPPMLAMHDAERVEDVLDRLRVPTQREGSANPLAQRSTEVRDEILATMGGSKETEQAVAMALDWLARHQSPNGGWDADDFDDDCGECGGETALNCDIAITGLAILAFLGADHTHDQPGPYRDNVMRALDWLVRQQAGDGGFLGQRDRAETMYSHGIASIAITEAYAITRDHMLREPAELATKFILAARNEEAGGWRYTPGQFGDTSVTGWQVMALASAKRGGMDIPANELNHVRRWMELVRHPDEPGRYGYQPGRQYTDAMTAEGMFVQQLLGMSRDDRDMRASAAYLLDHLPNWDREPNTYYWYYASLAMFHHGGDEWDRWNEALKRALIPNQRMSGEARGSWDPVDQWSREGGRVYQTAICALCLEIYYRYPPISSEGAPIEPVGTIRGVVVDRETDEPLKGAVVSLDLPDRPAITATTGSDGRYLLLAPEMSEFFAISASKEAYVPQSMTAAADELRGKVLERNFALERVAESIIAIESNPEVHHLGNDLFEGRINSQFQRKAEGVTYEAEFTITQSQLERHKRAELHMLCKGVQASNVIRINGKRLPERLDESPRDGSYGEFVVEFDMDRLEAGRNTISITSSDDLGDLDDFEFVNIQIRLLPD